MCVAIDNAKTLWGNAVFCRLLNRHKVKRWYFLYSTFFLLVFKQFKKTTVFYSKHDFGPLRLVYIAFYGWIVARICTVSRIRVFFFLCASMPDFPAFCLPFCDCLFGRWISHTPVPTFPSNFNSAIYFTSKQVAPQAPSGGGRRGWGDCVFVIVQWCYKGKYTPSKLCKVLFGMSGNS